MKKYIKGKHEYIYWDKTTKQVKKIKKEKRKTLKIEVSLDEETSTCKADGFNIFFNKNEFIIDALKSEFPDKLRVVSRIILSPKTAKKLSLQKL